MYELPKELRDALINYLGTRPMVEIESAVNALRQLKEIVPEQKEVAKE